MKGALNRNMLSSLWLAEAEYGRFDPGDDRYAIAARRIVWMLFDAECAEMRTYPEWFCRLQYRVYVQMATEDLDPSTSDEDREAHLRHEYAALYATYELEPSLIDRTESLLPSGWQPEKRHEEAVELVRTAIVDVFSGALDPKGRVEAWIFGVVRNRIRHIWRDHGRMTTVEDETMLPAAPGRSDPFDCAESAEVIQEVHAAFEDLTPAEQEVGRMYLLEEYTEKEIAEARGTSDRTVENQVLSLKKKLAKNERLRRMVEP